MLVGGWGDGIEDDGVVVEGEGIGGVDKGIGVE